jgi:hypothetical protein
MSAEQARQRVVAGPGGATPLDALEIGVKIDLLAHRLAARNGTLIPADSIDAASPHEECSR